MVRALSPRSRSRARAGRGSSVETRRADLTLEGTGSLLAIEQNDGTNAEIMSRLDVPFWKGGMKRYGVAVSPLCMSISPLAQHRGVVFWSGVCVCFACPQATMP